MSIHKFPDRSQKRGAVEHPLEVKVDGQIWKLFIAEFTASDGIKSSFEFYALDIADADARIAAIRATATLSGELFGQEPA